MKKFISPCFLFFGVLCLSASIFIGYFLIPYKVREEVMEQSKIVRGNTMFKNWEVIPVPLFQKIYFFNVTNPTEVIKGEKPILQEIGPYVYQQKRRKFDIVFNEQNDTIFYKERMDYFFRPDLSSGTESDRLVTINIPLVGAVQKATDMGTLYRYIVTDVLKEHPSLQLYLYTTVGEIMFQGIYLPFLKDLSEMRGDGEPILPNNTFGLYYGKNGSDNGRFEIYSGAQQPERFGNVVSWNGMSQLDWWEDEYCNRINGSDGAVFSPFVTKDKTLQMFIPGLCKSFKFTFESDELTVKDIPVLKYSISPSFFESGKTNPENRCYCKNPEDPESCTENGIFPLLGCGKAVMVLSQPHFYQGSQLYTNQSIGLLPEKDRHEMALYIESYTAASAKAKIRFQMNVDLRPNKFFKPLKKIPKMIHPIFWIDQTVEIPDEPAALLKEKLYRTVNMANLLTHVGIIVGSALILVSLLCFFLCSPNSSGEQLDQNKVECVSYHAQGTLPKEKILLNGIHGNRQVHNIIDARKSETSLEAASLLNHVLAASVQDSELLSCPQDALSVSASQNSPSNQTNDDKQSSSHLEGSNMPLLSSPQSLKLDPINQPDSRLSPFPSTTDYPSSLSITANRELVEAVSSYENL